MAEEKRHSFRETICRILGCLPGRSVVKAAGQGRHSGEGNDVFPILVHTEQGPVVLKLAGNSDDYNAWFVRGDIPEPPFPTEELFRNPDRLQRIDTQRLTVSGSNVALDIKCGTLCGGEVQGTMNALMWSEVGPRKGKN